MVLLSTQSDGLKACGLLERLHVQPTSLFFPKEILVLQFQHELSEFGLTGTALLDSIPSTVHHLTLLLGDEWGTFGGPQIPLGNYSSKEKERTLRRISHAIGGKAKILEIVGLETLLLGCWLASPAGGWKYVDCVLTPTEVRAMMLRHLVDQGWKIKEAKKRVVAIIFTDRETYMGRSGGLTGKARGKEGWDTVANFLIPFGKQGSKMVVEKGSCGEGYKTGLK